MKRIILTFAIAAIAIVICTVQNDTCGPNEVYNSCGSACPSYCNKVTDPDEVCTMQCVIGCQCASGYTMEAVDSKTCISLDECSKMPKCGTNKTYYTRGNPCPPYCGQPADEPCPLNCIVQGCQCRPGYVLVTKNSTHCVRISDCKA